MRKSAKENLTALAVAAGPMALAIPATPGPLWAEILLPIAAAAGFKAKRHFTSPFVPYIKGGDDQMPTGVRVGIRRRQWASWPKGAGQHDVRNYPRWGDHRVYLRVAEWDVTDPDADEKLAKATAKTKQLIRQFTTKDTSVEKMIQRGQKLLDKP